MNYWMMDVPQLMCPNPGGPIDIGAAVVHKTIGVWPGDRDYVRAKSLAHFTVGPDEGQWAQHAPINVFLAHCNGANYRAFGVEFSDLSPDGPLTDWQARAWERIRAWAAELGVLDVYLDPETKPAASVHVNTNGYEGWISHYNVMTDDGTVQHTDQVPSSSYLPPGDDDVSWSHWTLDEKLDFAKFIEGRVEAVVKEKMGAANILTYGKFIQEQVQNAAPKP